MEHTDTQKLVERLSNIFGTRSTKELRKLEDESKFLTKNIYDFLKTEEGKLGIPRLRNVLPYLHIDSMSAEQIWQQIEFHNSAVISMSTDESALNKFNLCVKIAELSSQFINNEDEEDNDETDIDDGVELEDETEEENEKSEDRTSDFDDDDVPSEEEEDQVKDDAEEDLPDNLSEFSDLDKDTFGDIAVEGDDSDNNDDDDEEDNDLLDEDKSHHDPLDESNDEDSDVSKPRKSFHSSQVDSKFFNLRESEWIADNDILGKSFDNDDDDEDVDLMEDTGTEQSDDEGKDAMYNSFFDPPSTEDAQQKEEDSEKDKISKFEASVAQEISMKEDLEKETFLTEKPWILKGEVQKKERPENSALEHHLEYNVAVRQKPIITEETTKNIEKLILDRIRAKCWDDVERKIKPVADPFNFKQKLILDEEKSKKSLASIYEEEFLRKQQEEKSGVHRTLSSILSESDEKWEELPIHKEIKKEMGELFIKLDALSNCHYTPRYRRPEIKVVSNLPAVTIEETTPAAVSDATLLAPQEVVAPLRGELKGETEKDKTDKSRERRAKKRHQHARAQREEEKLDKQLKMKDRDGLMRKDASVKFVQKAAKQGFVKVLDNQQKSVKSSKGFFDQLQNNIAERTNKKRKRQDDKEELGKKKKGKPLTMTRLLL